MMKLKNYFTILMASFVLINTAAATDLSYGVPFNVKVAPGNRILAVYDFNPATQTLVCKTDSIELASIAWKYKEALNKTFLPVTLSDNPQLPGNLADPNGKLIIKNDFGPQDMIVTCEYTNSN